MSGNELFSLILMVVILIGVGVFVSQPILRAKPENILHDEYAETPMHHLLSKKDSIYTGMKDLEFDYTTDKLSEEDYQALRAKLASQAADVLKEIDELEAGELTVAKKTAPSVCGDCGFKNNKGDRFCQSCGSKLA